MSNVKDIVKKFDISRDDAGWRGVYLSHYAEGGTRAEVENKLLDKVNNEKKHQRPKRKKTYESMVFWGVICLN